MCSVSAQPIPMPIEPSIILLTAIYTAPIIAQRDSKKTNCEFTVLLHENSRQPEALRLPRAEQEDSFR